MKKSSSLVACLAVAALFAAALPGQDRVLTTYGRGAGLFAGAFQLLGTSVAVVGDVNKDGYVDIVAGAPTDGRGPGTAVVISGRDGRTLFTLTGDSAADWFGVSVDGAGDVNKDGIPDIVVGAYFDDNNGRNASGSVRVLSGKDGKALFTRDGDAAGDNLGQSVAGVGDINGDGHADVMAGAPAGDYARVYSGKDGKTLFTFKADTNSDRFGISVSGCGDVNKDGTPDIVVGANFDDNNNRSSSGSVRVFSGKDGKVLYTFNGDSGGDSLGISVSGAGDIDKDGHADIIAGAYFDDNNGSQSGSARIYSGKTGKVLYTFNGDSAGDLLGISVSEAGDINNDSYPDVVVGAFFDDNAGAQSGSARVYSGKDGKVLFTVNGTAAGDRFGKAVAGGADINGDGTPDIVVGACEEDNALPTPIEANAGSMRVVSGRPLSFVSDRDELEYRAAGGKQNLTLNAGKAHALRLYRTFGAVTGTRPGITLGGVKIPLNPDVYTSFALPLPASIYVGFSGRLDASGKAKASLVVPSNMPKLPSFTLYHAYVVYDASNNFYFASNPVPVVMR